MAGLTETGMTPHEFFRSYPQPILQPDDIIGIEDKIQFPAAVRKTFHIRPASEMEYGFAQRLHALREFFFYVIHLAHYVRLLIQLITLGLLKFVFSSAISRSQAAQLSAVKRLGGAPQ